MRRTIRSKTWIAVIAVLLVFIAHSIGVLHPITQFVQRALIPVQRYFYSRDMTPEEPAEFSLRSRADLVAMIIRERAERAALEQKQITASVIAQECSALQQSVGFVSRLTSYRAQLANVVGRGSAQGPEYLMIDHGTDDGVVVGAAVTTPEGVLVGSIASVQSDASFVRLLTHPHAAVAVAREKTGSLIGMVQGKFGLSAELTLVPKDSDLQPGELLYTAGSDAQVPPGILVGSIETITPEQNSQFMHGIIELRFAPESLRLVTVLLPKNQTKNAPL